MRTLLQVTRQMRRLDEDMERFEHEQMTGPRLPIHGPQPTYMSSGIKMSSQYSNKSVQKRIPSRKYLTGTIYAG